MFVRSLRDAGVLREVVRIKAEMYGSRRHGRRAAAGRFPDW